jgi:hypothetical protein
MSEVGASTLRETCVGLFFWRSSRSNRGLKVIADHFENCFSIYRRDFLKMIADHFSFAILLQLCNRHWQINLGTIQCVTAFGYTLKPLTFRAECGQPGISWDNQARKARYFHSCAFGQRLDNDQCWPQSVSTQN